MDLLGISAIEVDTRIVEAFEALYGSPTMGIQWHPKCYLPEMPGEEPGSKFDTRTISVALFEFMIFAAQTYRQRKSVMEELQAQFNAGKYKRIE